MSHGTVWERWLQNRFGDKYLPGNLPSQYAATNDRELAAEYFASLQTVRVSEWTDRMKEFDILVDPFRAVRKYTDADWEALGKADGLGFLFP
jgi:hypothetical protein